MQTMRLICSERNKSKLSKSWQQQLIDLSSNNSTQTIYFVNEHKQEKSIILTMFLKCE